MEPILYYQAMVILEGLKEKRRFQVQAQKTRLNTNPKIISFFKKSIINVTVRVWGDIHATASI